MQDMSSIRDELLDLEHHLHKASIALAETGDVESKTLDDINELIEEALSLLWELKIE